MLDKRLVYRGPRCKLKRYTEMAKILDTQGVSSQLEGIIKNAKERLVIISPYLGPSERIKRLLQRQSTRKTISVTVIYREGELRSAVEEWLSTMPSLTTGSLQNLHAKCYLNENHALLTSMNLLESSQILSYEMGIVVSREEEPQLFETIDQELKNLIRKSEINCVAADQASNSDSSKRNAAQEMVQKKAGQPVATPKNGFCIQCKDHLPANPTKPYCRPCFANWSVHKNRDHKENYCHICGNKRKTSLRKPSCPACYSKYKDVLEWPAS